MTTPARPVRTRIEALDVLRGLALFGVLAINLDSEFRVTLFEQFLPSPPMPPLDRAVATVLAIAVEFKAFALFSLLFGVGLAIQFERLAGRPDRLTLLVRRLLALLAFGLIHLALIWNGDILTEYALAGFVVLPFLFAATPAVAFAAVVALALYLAEPWLPLPVTWPSYAWLTAHVATARDAYEHGSFGAILRFRISEIPDIAPLHGYVFPRTASLMLIGVLAWRSGAIEQAGRHARVFRNAAAPAIGLGLALTALPGRPATSLAPVVLAIGYAALVLWLMAGTRLRSLLAWTAPIGQMAFTNYIAQSVILGVLFYGYGFGLMGELGPAAGFGVAVALFAAQAVASAWWLRTHRFGPIEWLWRTLMYGVRQPWVRNRPAAA